MFKTPFLSALLLVFLSLFLITCSGCGGGTSKAPDVETTVLPPVKPPTPLPDLTRYFDEANTESETAIDESLQNVLNLFLSAQSHTRSFADDALGWKSKGKLVWDYLPFTQGGLHETFLKQKFEEKIMSEYQLSSAISLTVKSYLQRLENIDNNMLTKILMELDADLDDSAPKDQSDNPGTSFQKKVQKIIADVRNTTAESVATDVGLVIASEVVQRVCARMAVSLGILGTGAATSGYTFGISIAVGFIIDIIVTKIWDWWADPKGDLALEINQQLNTIRSVITNELRQELREIAKAQDSIRREYYPKAIQTHIQQQ